MTRSTLINLPRSFSVKRSSTLLHYFKTFASSSTTKTSGSPFTTMPQSDTFPHLLSTVSGDRVRPFSWNCRAKPPQNLGLHQGKPGETRDTMFPGFSSSLRTSCPCRRTFCPPRGFVRDKRSPPLPNPSEFSGMFTILLSFSLDPASRQAYDIPCSSDVGFL